MAAAATNRAAGDVESPTDVAVSRTGTWKRWRPFNAALIGVHLVGATGLLYANKGRLGAQQGVVASSATKAVLTVAALGASAYAGVLGKKISDAGDVAMDDATTATSDTPDEVADALRQQSVLQWVIPALTGAIIVVAALQENSNARHRSSPAPCSV